MWWILIMFLDSAPWIQLEFDCNCHLYVLSWTALEIRVLGYGWNKPNKARISQKIWLATILRLWFDIYYSYTNWVGLRDFNHNRHLHFSVLRYFVSKDSISPKVSLLACPSQKINQLYISNNTISWFQIFTKWLFKIHELVN